MKPEKISNAVPLNDAAARDLERTGKRSEDFGVLLERKLEERTGPGPFLESLPHGGSSSIFFPSERACWVGSSRVLAAYQENSLPCPSNRIHGVSVSREELSDSPFGANASTLAGEKTVNEPTAEVSSTSEPDAGFSRVISGMKGFFSRLFSPRKSAASPETASIAFSEAEPGGREAAPKPAFESLEHLFQSIGTLFGFRSRCRHDSEKQENPFENAFADNSRTGKAPAGKGGAKRVATRQNLPIPDNRGADLSFGLKHDSKKHLLRPSGRNVSSPTVSSNAGKGVLSMGGEGDKGPSVSEPKKGIAESMRLEIPPKILEVIHDTAHKYDLPANLVAALIKVESNFNPRAVSKDGARGLMQLMPHTAKKMEVKNRFDIRQNVDGGCRYLKDLLERFDGKLELAVAAYNAGPRAVEKHKGIPPYRQTQRYVRKVMAYC